MRRYPKAIPYINSRAIRKKQSAIIIKGKAAKHYLIGGAVGALSVIFTGFFAEWTADKNRDVQYLEYANKLLTLPVDRKNRHEDYIRNFAIEIIDKKSPVTLSDELKKDLKSFQMPLSVIGASEQNGVVSRLYARTVSEHTQNTQHKTPPKGLPAKPSAPESQANLAPITKFGIVSMPEDISDMWVFYQIRDQQNFDGCRRPLRDADPLDPKTFASRLSEFIADIREGEDMIITAMSPGKDYLAVREISIEGIKLQHNVPYYCNKVKSMGSKLHI